MKNLSLYLAAAIAEIAGCYAFWMSLKLKRSPLWALAGFVALIAFAWLLSRIDMSFAGRAYAAYGGIYVASALVWMKVIEGARPDRWDVIGVAICLIGTVVIVFGPRTA